MAESPWYTRAFDADYLRVYAHRSPQQARQQVQAMQQCGLLPRAGRVLDIACGAGRHVHAMRQVGLDARGLDYSSPLLRSGSLAGLAVRADMRAIPYADGIFDWAGSLFTSFGYFDSADDDRHMFREAARVLKPGGSLVIDHINPVVTLRDLRPETVETRDGFTLTQRRSHRGGVITKEITLEQAGVTQTWHEKVRCYAPVTLDALLHDAGLRVVRRHGDLDGTRWDEPTSPRQVLLAQRS